MAAKTQKKTFSTDWKDNKATSRAVADFESKFAADMGFKAVRSDVIEPYKVIPTGTLALDYATGIGGFPVGRVIEIWGPEHAGKTTEAMLAVASAQRTFPDKMTAWVDMEQTFDKAWAQKLGVDLKRLWLIENPKTAEDVADATKRFVTSGLCSLVVLDSVGGMISRMEMEKEADEATVAAVAKIVTRMVKMVSPVGKSNNTTTLVINQVRANIGAMKGPQTQTSGGWALRHITTMRLNVKRGGSLPKTIKIDGFDVPVGHEVSIKIEKNKCAAYGRTAVFWIYNQPTDKYGDIGVDPLTEAIEFGKKLGIIEGSTWLTLPNGERFNGAAKTADYLREHPEVMHDIRDKVLATLAGELKDEDLGADEDPADLANYLAAAGGEAE